MTTATTQQQQRDIQAKIENNQLTISCSNGKQLIIQSVDFNPDIVAIATLHGFKQKIVDAAAMSSGATIDEKWNAMAEVFNRLRDGEWNKRRESGEPRGGLLFNALCLAYPTRKPEEVRVFLDGKSRKEQNAMLENSRIRPHVDAIRAEMSKNIESDDLLSELED
jgi:hypothetical protein